MPPGTGDVQLTICQDLELSGAVSVTTPSKLAATDAAKGIEMFTSLGVPTLAIVENMSYFDVSTRARTRMICMHACMFKHACSNYLLQYVSYFYVYLFKYYSAKEELGIIPLERVSKSQRVC